MGVVAIINAGQLEFDIRSETLTDLFAYSEEPGIKTR